MSDLFGLEDDDDNDLDAVAERDARRMRQSVERNPEEPEDIPVNPLEVDDEEDDDEDSGNRDAKKRERPALRRALEEERELNRKTREELAELRGQMSQIGSSQRVQHSGAPPVDQIQQQIDATFQEESRLRREAQSIYDSAASGRTQVTDETRREFETRYQQLTQRRQELTTAKVMRDHNIRPSDPSEGVRAAIQAQYSDVYGHPQAAQYVGGLWQQMRAQGHKDSPELLRLVMGKARSAFKLKGPDGNLEPPSNARRNKYTGSSSAGAGSGSTRRNTSTVRMTPDMKGIAEAHYEHRSDLSSRQKHELWAKEIGPEYLKTLA